MYGIITRIIVSQLVAYSFVPLEEAPSKMKFVVLLAFVGLASCRTTLVGGDRARDVTLRYSYLDEMGREIDVDLEAERLSLGLLKPRTAAAPVPEPIALRASPLPEAIQYIQAVAPQPKPLYQTRTLSFPVPSQYIQAVAPQPKPLYQTRTLSFPVPSQYIQAVAPRPEPVYVTRVVEVPVTRYVQLAPEPVPAPVPEVVTRYVEIDEDDDDDDIPAYRAVQSVALPKTALPLRKAFRKEEISDDSDEDQ